jgi:hypothetical protein
MDRSFHRAQSFESAYQWDREQMWSMSADERLAIAKILRDRYYGKDAPDVRESERSRREE